MTVPTVTVRCPSCGGLLAAAAPVGTGYVLCPHCSAPVTVVPPRNPPPLFTWEVMPHLYPALPPVRGGSRRAVRPIVAAALALCLATSAIVVVLVSTDTAAALRPGHVDVAGRVFGQRASGGPLPLSGVNVTVTGENFYNVTVLSGFTGDFDFPSVPLGGVIVTAIAPGYDTAKIEMFFSTVYSRPTGSSSLSITLTPGVPTNSSVTALSPFVDLESFASDLLTSAVVFGVGGTMALLGLVAVVRQRRPGVAVAGSAAVVLAPFALPMLSLADVAPGATTLAAIGGLVGATALGLLVIPQALTAPAPED